MSKKFEAIGSQQAVKILDYGFWDIAAVFILPRRYHKHLRTTNHLGRLNREIRRRTDVIGIFPTEDSVVRLIGAVLMDIHEDWITGNRFLEMHEYNTTANNCAYKEEPSADNNALEGAA